MPMVVAQKNGHRRRNLRSAHSPRRPIQRPQASGQRLRRQARSRAALLRSVPQRASRQTSQLHSRQLHIDALRACHSRAIARSRSQQAARSLLLRPARALRRRPLRAASDQQVAAQCDRSFRLLARRPSRAHSHLRQAIRQPRSRTQASATQQLRASVGSAVGLLGRSVRAHLPLHSQLQALLLPGLVPLVPGLLPLARSALRLDLGGRGLRG